MKLSAVLQRMPDGEECGKFIRFLEATLKKDGDRDLSDDALREIELQVRAHIDPKFELIDIK